MNHIFKVIPAQKQKIYFKKGDNIIIWVSMWKLLDPHAWTNPFTIMYMYNKMFPAINMYCILSVGIHWHFTCSVNQQIMRCSVLYTICLYTI